MSTVPQLQKDVPCWKTIGILADRSCEQLQQHVHCRNCPTYRLAGRQLLDRPMPADYRTELTQRLARKPRERHTDYQRLLVFRVASVWLAMPSACFEQSLSPVPIVRVPARSNRHFLGLVNTHGELQLCFTLEHFIGPDPDEVAVVESTRAFPRLLVVRLQGQRWVFPADEVLGTVEHPLGSLQKLPANVDKSSHRLVSALFDLDALRIKLIDEARLAMLFQEALV
jgi:chemotaxis-related protein WspD